MALQHLRSSTAHKRPIPTVMSAGQIAINTNEASPGLFFKDSNGDLVKVGPVHIGTTAPNSSPASVAATALVTGTVYQILTVGTSDFTLVGASANTVGTIFTATGTTTGTGTVSGQQGVEKGEQWLDTTGGTYVLKIYDGTAWRSESGTFVDVNGDTMTGDLVMNNANIVFEGATADDFETTLTVTDPTADRTITLPNVTGTVVTTGDTGTVTSTMIADGTIVNADINASAAIAPSKIGSGALPSGVTVASTNIVDGTIVNADINASAAIAGTKIDPDFGSQTIETTGVFSAADGAAATPSITFTGDTNTGIYRPGADQVAISTNGTGRLFVDASGNVGVGASPITTFVGQTHLTVNHSAGGTNVAGLNLATDGTRRASLITYPGNSEALRITAESATLPITFHTNSSERMRIDSSGSLNIKGAGTAGVTQAVHFNGSAPVNSLVVNSSGSVGIGTSSPDGTLHVQGTNSGGTLEALVLKNNATATNTETAIRFVNTTSSFNHASIVATRSGSGTLDFYTADSANAAMRIDSSGNVGIGNISPANSAGYNTLTIGNGTSTGGQLLLENAAGNNFFIWHDSNGANIYNQSATSQIFYTNAQERMRINSSGRVGIGTSSPGQLIQIGEGDTGVGTNVHSIARIEGRAVGGGEQVATLEFNQITNAPSEFVGASIGIESSAGTRSESELVFKVSQGTNTDATEAMRLSHDGRLGIGTTVPSARLESSDTNAGEVVATQLVNRNQSGTADSVSLQFRMGRTPDTAILRAAKIQAVKEGQWTGTTSTVDAALTFHTSLNESQSEKMRIDSSGRLLVGTSSTQADTYLVVEGQSGAATGPGTITLARGSNTPGDGNGIGQIFFTDTDHTTSQASPKSAASILCQRDGGTWTSGSSMPSRLVFSTTADGASSPTEHIRIDNAGTTTVWSTSAPMLWGRNETSGSVTGLSYYNTATSTTSLTGQVFRVMCDGDVENANNAYGAISDVSLKENIVDANSQWADIKALAVRNYNFKAETGLNTHTQIGLVAQEVELISPGLVGECIDDNTGETSKTISYSVLYMKAVKALQEAMERIETLETSNADLLARVSALEAS